MPSSAGTTTRCLLSESATSRRSPSRSKSAARLPDHIVFRSSLGAKNFDFQTVEYLGNVKLMEKASPALRGSPASGPECEAEQRHG